ncbi:septum formation initiator family protein [Malonomonas rubra]|uniref:FtsB family cell division protein n=1 Tax=Malonomonas rubra TaxID=57040 RepID=UPI0026ED4165|nr:septum formation initiator family protein [Malonomonas rubra]
MSPAREPATAGQKNLISIWLLLIIIVMLGYAVFGERGVIRIMKAERQKQQLEVELVALKQEQQLLRDEIDRLKNDKDYWELLARKKLGMVREGELIYHLPSKEKN